MTTYISGVNEILADASARIPNVLLYGENIDNGSRIAGLTKGLRVDRGGRVINVGNCEATHCGVGFGLMLAGVPAVLYAKQLDFMLLGADHFVSTYNEIRSIPGVPSTGSFTIVTIVCDQGYQGPQSSFNALADLCSLAQVPGYAITDRRGADAVIRSQIGAPGFRFVALSQRLFGTELLDVDAEPLGAERSIFRYREGSDATIVCCNFSLPEGLALADALARDGHSASVFKVDAVFPLDWSAIVRDATRTGRLAILDDSKGAMSPGSELAAVVASADARVRTAIVRRAHVPFHVDPETFAVDVAAISAQLFTSS